MDFHCFENITESLKKNPDITYYSVFLRIVQVPVVSCVTYTALSGALRGDLNNGCVGEDGYWITLPCYNKQNKSCHDKCGY